MEFQRARSDEQKDIRMKQISDSALELLKTSRYDDITLAAIAKNLCFTRANLYKYISSKEEIFLHIIIEEIKKWRNDIEDTFAGVVNPDREKFAEGWARLVYKNNVMVETMSLLYSILEKNVTLDKLVEFKKQLFFETSEVVKLLMGIFPGFTQKTAFMFIRLQLFYVMGLYPASTESEIQRKAIEIAGVPFVKPDFAKELSEFIMMEFCRFNV